VTSLFHSELQLPTRRQARCAGFESLTPLRSIRKLEKKAFWPRTEALRFANVISAAPCGLSYPQLALIGREIDFSVKTGIFEKGTFHGVNWVIFVGLYWLQFSWYRVGIDIFKILGATLIRTVATKSQEISGLYAIAVFRRALFWKKRLSSKKWFRNGARGGAPQPTLKTPKWDHSAERPHEVHREARNFWVTWPFDPPNDLENCPKMGTANWWNPHFSSPITLILRLKVA